MLKLQRNQLTKNLKRDDTGRQRKDVRSGSLWVDSARWQLKKKKKSSAKIIDNSSKTKRELVGHYEAYRRLKKLWESVSSWRFFLCRPHWGVTEKILKNVRNEHSDADLGKRNRSPLEGTGNFAQSYLYFSTRALKCGGKGNEHCFP